MHQRIPTLDGLRAFSILCVIAGHCAIAHKLMMADHLAGFGVQVFFVISGYLISTLLLKEHARTGGIDLRAFYIRRSFRIFPAAFTYIGIVALLAPAARPDLAYALTYTMSYHTSKTSSLLQHLWSLSCEELFYLLWPLALVIGFRWRGRIAVVAIVLAAAFRISCYAGGTEPLRRVLHFYFPSVVDSLAAGCLLAIYAPDVRKRFGSLSQSSGVALCLPVLTFIVAVLLWSGPAVLTIFWGVIPLLIALSMFILIERGDWILNNRAASAIGVLSYSLYLWQQPFTLADRASLVVSLVLLVSFATTSYAVVEHPMLKLGARLGKSRDPRLPTAMPQTGLAAQGEP